jgi:hypothetical protein
MSEPLVSIILCVRNGMPHVREAVESVRAQTYGHYELVVQDAASTDGTREYLEQLSGFGAVSFKSEPDNGQGQGFNRALKRCRGEIIGSVDSDNRLRPDAVATAVRAFAAHPGAAVVYGACDMIDEQGSFLHLFQPAKFDLLGLLNGSIVPPFATSYFAPAVCGDRLYFDEDFLVVPDFALWLRLSDLPIVRILDVLSEVRAGQQSSTYQPGSYDQHTHFKLFAARQFLSDERRQRALDALAHTAEAGISLWAVDSMHVIGAPQERVDHYFQTAVRGDIRSERFRAIVTRAAPRIANLDSDLEAELLTCGIEYRHRLQPEAALVYFELLQRSGSAHPALTDLIDQSRRTAREIHLSYCVDVIDAMQDEINIRERELARLQGEVNLRDRLLAEQEAHLQSEIQLRDRLLDEERRTAMMKVRMALRLGERVRHVLAILQRGGSRS